MTYVVVVFAVAVYSVHLNFEDVNKFVEESVAFRENDYICIDCGERKDGERYCTGGCDILTSLEKGQLLLNQNN